MKPLAVVMEGSRSNKVTDFVRPLWHHAVVPPVDGTAIEIVRGDGIYVWDAEGKRYIDGFSMRGTAAVGHGRTELVDAASEQMRRGGAFQLVLGYTNAPARRLAERLLGVTGHPGGAVWFHSSGSEAIEAAIRIALNYHLNRGEPQRRMILTCRNAYHGNTLGAAAASGLPDHDHFICDAASNFVRLPATPHQSEISTVEFIAALRDTLTRIGANRIAALIAEPIPGMGGFRVPIQHHWREVKSLLADHGILLVMDEVFNGFGRTGTMLAQHYFGVRGDLITFAKALTSGYVPLSACVASEHVAAAFEGVGPHALMHIGTYTGHPVACAVGLRNLDVIESEQLVENAAVQGDRLRSGLEKIAAASEGSFEAPQGKGLAYSMALSGEDSDKERWARAIQLECQKRGLIMLAREGLVTFTPPLIVTPQQIDEILNIFESSVRDVLQSGR